MKRKHTASRPSPFGFVLLLIVFLTLAFFTFAAISLSTAIHDKNVSQSLSKHSTAYTAAANQAEETIASFNCAAASHPQSAAKTKHFSIKISKTQTLQVTCRWDADTASYQTDVWKVENTKDWQSETHLPLIIEKQ